MGQVSGRGRGGKPGVNPFLFIALLIAFLGGLIIWLALDAEEGREAGLSDEHRVVLALPASPPEEAQVAKAPEAEALALGPAESPGALPFESVAQAPAPEPVAPEAPEPGPVAQAPVSEPVAPEVPEPGPTVPAEPEALPRDAPTAEPALEAAPEVGPPQEEVALAPGPDEALSEFTSQGSLPVIGPDGREPWLVYARPFDPDDSRPLIAIVLSGLGLSQAATDAAIRLPGVVTLSFAAYASGLRQWSARARAAGHELLLDIPMEPLNYPTDDPGPHTLLTSLNPVDNIARLEWLLSRFTGYVGVVDHMGSKFAASSEALRPVLDALNERGLMILDSRSALDSAVFDLALEMKLPSAANDGFLDDTASRESIDWHLAELERMARETGYAVGIGRAYPVTIERIAAWLPTLEERGIAPAPVSAVAKRRWNR